MFYRELCLLAFCSIGLSLSFADKPAPKWPKVYKVTGVIKLPYAEIEEPFTAWVEQPKGRSRIDYYDGTVKTIQIAAANKTGYGQNFKIAPAFLSGKNQKKCFLVNGTKDAPGAIQSVLPDLAKFEKIGPAEILDKPCELWRYIDTTWNNKKSTYSLYVNSSGQPLRYEMMGFDSLLGSHYDKYYVDYEGMDVPKNGSFSDDVFKPDQGLDCGGFPGPGDASRHIIMNPMREYMDHYDTHTDETFEHFKKTHNKHYPTDKEHSQRKHLYRQNLRFVSSKNRAGLTYSLEINHLADLTSQERAAMRGYRHMTLFDPHAVVFDGSQIDEDSLPDQMDWRLYGAVTPVKDQAVCGSCWSFGTTGTIEGAYYLKTGKLVRMSQQELMDCSWDQGNNACDGGEDFRAYQWITKNGLATEEDYGPYLSQDGVCHFSNVTKDRRVYVDRYYNVTTNSAVSLRAAIFKHGPVSVAIDASHKSLSFYANGIYFEPECGNGPDSLDHAVLAVGYGVINMQSYWLVKNSWSTYWGNAGYVLMSQNQNNCGVETMPTFVTIN